MPPAKEAATRDATAHGVGSRPVVDAREDAREDGMLHRKVELGRNGEKVRGSATAISVLEVPRTLQKRERPCCGTSIRLSARC